MDSQRLVLEKVTYFDSLTAKLEHDKAIVMEKNKITWIGDCSSLEKEKDDKLIHIPKSHVILPGLIDCHVHIGMQMGINYEREYMRTKTDKYGYYGLKNSWLHLISGFTTLRDCGSGNFASSLRNLFDTGYFPGPKLVVAQRPITQYGNQEFVGPKELYTIPDQPDIVSGSDGIIHAVRDRIKSGSDFIKTITTGGVLHGQSSKLARHFFTNEELEAMVTEAHRMGIHVASHAHGNEGIYSAIKAGIDTIEHGSFISDGNIRLMKEKGTFLVPTQTSAFIDKPELMKNLPQEVIDKTTVVDKAMFERHKIAYEQGVNIALGTDAGVPGNIHGTSAREITSMVEKVGMTPEQAIQCATIEASKAIKVDDEIGSIEVGKIADLIVVTKNPLQEIKVLENKRNIAYVIKNGFVVAENGILLPKFLK